MTARPEQDILGLRNAHQSIEEPTHRIYGISPFLQP